MRRPPSAPYLILVIGALALLVPAADTLLPIRRPSSGPPGGGPGGAGLTGSETTDVVHLPYEDIATFPSDIGGSGGLLPSMPSPASLLALARSLGRNLGGEWLPWAMEDLRAWLPFGPGLRARPPLAWVQPDAAPPLVSDSRFVWGPADAQFDVQAYLLGRGSSLAAFSDDVALWSSYSSVNPRVLLAVLELRYGWVTGPAVADAGQVREQIQSTAIELASAFYEHLYIWGERRSHKLASPSSGPAVMLADGTVAIIDPNLSSGSAAVVAALAGSKDTQAWLRLFSPTAPEGFPQVFGSLFPGADPLASASPITPSTLPPSELLQFPFPLGATWAFNGPHSWNGGSYPPPYSSMDFYSGGATCSSPPGLFSVAAASGTGYRPSGYSCWLEINHGDGWTTSYYHLRNMSTGGAMERNARAGTIACEVCAGGFATGPHVHFSLKYHGAYVSLEGVNLSGWTVHVGDKPYSTGSIKRGGVVRQPYSTVNNDYHLYFPRPNASLRFYGNGVDDIDRIKILIDDPLTDRPGPPADVGATDFTFEFWMKAHASENAAAAVECGANTNWTSGHILIDRSRFGHPGGGYGVSIAGGVLVFGVTGEQGDHRSMCGTTTVVDGTWHHVAVQRRASDGWMWMYVDGNLNAEGDGPDGNTSYPDDAVPSVPGTGFCEGPSGTWGGTCVNDSYLVLGAEKHDVGPSFPSFSGWLDEIRISDVLRYAGPFVPLTSPFASDSHTVGLYHFHEGVGNQLNDVSGYPAGPSNGTRQYGGTPPGPEWSADVAFQNPTPTPTPAGSTTPTAASSPTATVTPSSTPTSTRTATATPTSSPSSTPTATSSPTGTQTPSSSFADVPTTHWAYPYIEALYNAGYTAGCATDPLRYCPDVTMNRAESAVFVERGIHGVDALPPQPTYQTFADLPLDSWAAKWVEALWQDHYTAGCGTDPLVFCPWQGHTRAEGCVFYLRMLYGPDFIPAQPSQQTFTDVPLGTWYTKWVQAAHGAGLIPACSESPLRFCPEEPLTRARAAYMMVQAKQLELP